MFARVSLQANARDLSGETWCTSEIVKIRGVSLRYAAANARDLSGKTWCTTEIVKIRGVSLRYAAFP